MRSDLMRVAAALGAAAVLFPVLPPSASAAVPSSATVESYMRQAFEATSVPGLAAVVTDGARTVYAGGLGRDATGGAITADSPMRVASVSKSMTAAAVLTLVDEGKVRLDEPVPTYLPDFTMADPRAARITVRQLLNQTSGLSDAGVDIPAVERASSLAGYVAVLRTGHLTADPGKRMAYCNVNYDLAARVVEAVTGRGFPDVMRERVFGPLGMADSGIGSPSVGGYVSVFGAWVGRDELPGFTAGGAGDVVTTATDMGRWLASQTGRGRRLLTPGSLAAMQVPSAVNAYGMGWQRGTVGSRSLLVHSGNLFTHGAIQAISPETGHGFAVMTNSASLHEASYDVLVGLVEMVSGRAPTIPGAGRQQTELVLGGVGLVALGLGVTAVRRARHWATRGATRSRASTHRRWRAALRMVPALVPVLVFASYPQLLSLLMNGRTVTWAQLMYFPLPLTLVLGAAALSGLATIAARLLRLRSVG
ncbi:serine hydrolase domain-containing protein [Pilimelia columellifera]|uniref:Serine hydrolase domain-containing protein n=1 Tax=Pilimelia columellifera subsp. columellifera TaxID=706583 RepID=A0ABP6B1R9_9ACTN